jgi:sensor c-di-GMP phosphodiesterase-like protein
MGRNIAAMAAGVLLAAVPSFAFEVWLGRIIDRQGQEEIDTSVKRAVSLAESRVAEAIRALDALAAEGINDCRLDRLAAMRRTTFNVAPIKEIAVVARDGQTLCTDIGLPIGQRSVETTEELPGAEGYVIDLIRLDDGREVVRLRRPVGTGATGLAAILPSNQFVPRVATRGDPFDAYARLKTSKGTLIGQVGERPSRTTDGLFEATARSDRFGFTAQVIIPRGKLAASQNDLRWLGIYASSAIVLVVGFVTWLTPRRDRDNPITELKRALAAGEFVPYYQPIVDIMSGQLRGAEVLVRWKRPDGSLVLPAAFIPLVESSGLIRAMTRALMRRVCAEVGPAVGRRPALKVSFNFAGRLFSDKDIVDDVRKIFSASPIKLSQVVLELTERDPIENFTETRQRIAALQELGVRIAIDDVGTGHSGLSYMLKLGVDIIKIDKMFVDAIGTDRNSTTIVETLIDLAHNMRMDVVAEGVENFEQVVHLRELGVRSAQGYVFAPPLPGSAFLQLIEAIDPLPQRAAQPRLPAAARPSAA